MPAGCVSPSCNVCPHYADFSPLRLQALLDSPDTLTRSSAFAIASTNIEKLLGLSVDPYESDLVATSGGDLFSFEGKVIAVISPRRGKVDYFE
jgi:hypothetical protein